MTSRRVLYLLILPAVALELAVHAAPILLGAAVSVLRVTPHTLRDWTAAPFAGLANYRSALDPHGAIGADLMTSLWRTAAYAAVVVAMSWGAGLLAAVLLSVPFRGRVLLQALFLAPFALPAYASVLAWRLMLDRDDGVVNQLLVDDLHVVGDRPFWLIGGNALWATAMVAVWRLWPFAYLVLAAALRTVPDELHDSAALDGASAWQAFRWVVMPGIRRSNALVLLLLGLWSFTDFSTPYLLFGAEPPPAATLLGNFVYRAAFVDFNLGVASALNVLLAALLLLVTGIGGWRLFSRAPADA